MTGSAASSGQTNQKTSRYRQTQDAMIGYLKKSYAWVIACVIATVVAIVLGVSLGWRFRTRQLQDPGVGSVFVGRKLYVNMRLLSIDTSMDTVTFDWTINGDDCIQEATQANTPSDIFDCPLVNIYFDQNLLAQSSGGGSSMPSNGRPDQAVFQFNATALRFDNWSNAPFFRTVVNLYENVRTLQSSTENYPFDRYASQIRLFGLTNGTGDPVGISVYNTEGVATGYKALLGPPNHLDSILSVEGVTDLNFIIYRTVLVRVYAIVIIMAMWLVNLVLTAIMIKAVCFRYRMEPSVLVVPVSTLFAFASLRGTMPGAPASFGAIIDFVGTLPTFAFLIMSTLFCLLCFLFGEDYMKNPVKEKS